MGILKFVSDVCVQTAVYWGVPKPDGYGGTSYDDPIELSPPNGVRWDDQVEVITNSQGEEITSQARVLLLQEVEPEGLLWLGRLEDLTQSQKDDPSQIEDARKIQRVDENPLFQSTDEFVRQAYL